MLEIREVLKVVKFKKTSSMLTLFLPFYFVRGLFDINGSGERTCFIQSIML